MALSYRQAKDLYDLLHDSGVVQSDLPTWSRGMNQAAGSNLYDAGLSDNFLKRTSVGLDRFLEETGVPKVTGDFGAEVGSLIGAEEQGRSVGESLPRSAADFAPLALGAIPGPGWLGVAGLGLTGLLSGAKTYTDTGSPAAGILSGATNVLLPGVAHAAEQGALKALGAPLIRGRIASEFTKLGEPILAKGVESIAKRVPQNLGQGLGSLLAGQTAAAGFGEVSGMGQQVLAGQPVNFDPKATLLGATLGQLPFLLPYATRGGRVQFGGETAREHTAQLESGIKATETALAQRDAEAEAHQEPPLSKIPTISQNLSPKQAGELQFRLDQLRGQMKSAKDEATPLSMEEWNRLSQEESALVNQQGYQPDAVMGGRLTDTSERVPMVGQEVFHNPKTGYRIIETPEGERYGYSTRGEPEPQLLSDQPGFSQYSLPKGWMDKVTDYHREGQSAQPELKQNLTQDAQDLLNSVADGSAPAFISKNVARIARENGVEITPQDRPEDVFAKLKAKGEVVPNFDHVKALADAHALIDTSKSLADNKEAIDKANAVRSVYGLKPLNDAAVSTRMRVTKNPDPQAAIKSLFNKTAREIKAKLSPEDKEQKAWEEMPQVDKENIQRSLVAKGGEFEDVQQADETNLPVIETALEHLDRIMDNSPAWKVKLEGLTPEQRREAELAMERFKVYLPARILGDLGSGKTLTESEAEHFNSLLSAQGISVPDHKTLMESPSQVAEMTKVFNDTLKLGSRRAAPPTSSFRPLPAGQSWLFSMGPYDPATNTLNGKHKLPRDGSVATSAFRNMAGRGQPLTEGEIELYKQLVPEAFDGPTVNVPKLMEGLKSKGPVVEVKKLGDEKVAPNEAQQKLAELTHTWYDNLTENKQRHVKMFGDMQDPEAYLENKGWSPEDIAKANEYEALQNQVRGLGTFGNPGNASRFSFLGPKSEQDMPGYVEGLVRVPKDPQRVDPTKVKIEQNDDGTYSPTIFDRRDLTKKFNTLQEAQREYASPLFSGPHFGSEDTNVLAFFRGYEETLPDGRKAFHVIEVQSDWGQTIRGRKERNDARLVSDHPLLSVYETLALKAAIQHARSIGADSIILSDGETAMMTEGHDKVRQQVSKGDVDGESYSNKISAEESAKNLTEQTGTLHDIYDEDPSAGGMWRVRSTGKVVEPSQSRGMRLHYDTTLPSAMRKLTGSEGERVEVGRHDKAQSVLPGETRDDGAGGLIETQGGSPVFRNSDGTSKSSITGRLYPLDKAFRTMDEQDGFTLTDRARSPRAFEIKPGEKPFEATDTLDKDLVSSIGTTGQDLVSHLSESSNPVISALATDLSRFPEALKRISVGVWELPGASYADRKLDGTAQVKLNSGVLWAPEHVRDFELAHELLHGLTLHELANPTKADIVSKFDDLRQKLISSLPSDMKKAFNKAQEAGWYDKHASGDAQTLSTLHPDEKKAAVLYALFNNDELISQGFADTSVREYLQKQKSGGSWWNKFTNLVKQLVGIGERVDDNAFGELLGYTSQLLHNRELSSSLANFHERYFEQQGLSPAESRNRAQQALGLVTGSSLGTSKEELFHQLDVGQAKSGDRGVTVAKRNLLQMLRRPEDAQHLWDTLAEHGLEGSQGGLDELLHEGLAGTNIEDTLQVLPPEASAYVFSRLNDWRTTLDGIQAALSEKNKGVINLTDPKVIRGPVKDAIKSIDKLLDTERMLDEAVRGIQGMTSIAPDAFLDSIVRAAPQRKPGSPVVNESPEKSALGFLGNVIGKLGGNAIDNFLNKPAQLGRSNPIWGEAFSLASMMKSLAAHSAHESLKVFGKDISTGKVGEDFDPKNVDAFLKTVTNTRVRDAVDAWMYWNNKKGKDKVVMLPDSDSDVRKALGPLSSQEREQVTDIVAKIGVVNAEKNQRTLGVMQDISANLGARIAMAAGVPKLKDALAISSSVFEAAKADFNNPLESQKANALLADAQQKMPIDGFIKLLEFAQNEAQMYKDWQTRFQDNPYWASARRIGQYTYEYLEGGKWQRGQAESEKEAKFNAKGRPIRNLERQELTGDETPSMSDLDDEALKRFQQYEQNRISILKESGQISPELEQELQRLSPATLMARDAAVERSISPTLAPARKLSSGANELPWLYNHISGVFRNATYWQKRLTKIKAETMLAEPELASNPELQKQIRTHFDNLFYPDPQLGQGLTKFASIWGLGLNMATSLANLAQTPMRLLPELTRLTGKPLTSFKVLSRAMADYAGHRVDDKRTWASPDEDWFMKEAAKLGQIDATIFDENAASKDKLAQNFARALRSDKPQTLGEHTSTAAGAYSTAAMAMFREGERLNNSVALVSAYRTLKELNPEKGKEWLRDQAFLVNASVNDVGGKANRSVGLFDNKQPLTRNVAMSFNALQAYTLGSTFQLIRYLKEGGFGKEAQGLLPAEKYAARKAAVTMLGVQFAAAGLLGMPFATAALTLLDQAFPKLELRRKLREHVASWFSSDGENGNGMTDMFMSGVPSMLGWDMQSRLSMGNNLPGVNDINGFQPEQLLGAPAGMLGRFLRGGQQLIQGDTRGGYSFLPPAVKKLVELAGENGKVLDYKNRPVLDPTAGESIGMVLGFNPTRLSQFNNASRLQYQAETVANRREGQFRQQQAEALLQGKLGTVRQNLLQRAQTEQGYDPVAAARGVVSAAEELTFPRDLRNEATARSATSKLLSSFNIPVGVTSEEARFQFRQNLLRRLGVPVTNQSGAELMQARLMDQLRQQMPEATRTELRRAVQDVMRRSSKRSATLTESSE